jgi:hypothetical protein
MSWEWELKTKPQRWILEMGEWRAVVQRVSGSTYLWHSFVEATDQPFIHYDGPTDGDPMKGRVWCLGKIAALRWEK